MRRPLPLCPAEKKLDYIQLQSTLLMSLEKKVRRTLRQYLPAVYTRLEIARLRRLLRKAPPILIFQMSKVGSSSIKDSVAPLWPGLTVHTHDILNDRAARLDVRLVYDQVIRNGAPMLIISPVREPVGRAISGFFENFAKHTGIPYDRSWFSTDELIEIFLQRFRGRGSPEWFERMFQPVMRVDVYRHPFDPAGFQVIAENNTRILLLRAELSDDTKNKEIRDFLKLNDFSLKNSNIGANKVYAETYRAFKERFVPPEWFLSQMYDSRYFRHFYAGQREEWVARWTRRDGS